MIYGVMAGLESESRFPVDMTTDRIVLHTQARSRDFVGHVLIP
jgi:hypothetical protein